MARGSIGVAEAQQVQVGERKEHQESTGLYLSFDAFYCWRQLFNKLETITALLEHLIEMWEAERQKLENE